MSLKTFPSSLHYTLHTLLINVPQLVSPQLIRSSASPRCPTDRPQGTSRTASVTKLVPKNNHVPPLFPFYVASCELIHNFCLVGDNKNIDYVTVFNVRSSDSFNYLRWMPSVLSWDVDSKAYILTGNQGLVGQLYIKMDSCNFEMGSH